MANQYFENDPELDHQRETFDFTLLGQSLQLTTDRGVFSRARVDYGTVALLTSSAELLQTLAQTHPNFTCLDLGCGYGPVGISIAKAYPQAQVTMVDVNQRALALAEENAQANQVSAQVQIKASQGYSALTDQRFDLILTNPPVRAGKKVVSEFLALGQEHLQPTGQLLAVLQKKQGAPSALKLLQQKYPVAQVRHRDKGYYILQAQNQD
ncbi:class I SAM-dependent methyltransferase [Lapidilactobacillus luobeiensis]|uniref:class I SAM-dependent methyltransferase n=1 Tax=Lapidilactobacillus luobeiensis TaxID=2950371 RepID=UPI0021C29F92|nr:class I SAM-dependent methyltransferase [Lapidilactobacillus luobeiensis]